MHVEIRDDADQAIRVDPAAQVIEIFGVSYALALFHKVAFGPIGSVFELIANEDGVVTLKVLREPAPPESIADALG